ncbi:MAG: apolipoprotein N-acyltransferase [Bacteroidales bacterium]|nr:apolipoprotein N-acyltransferase [Bacteroidales bacterium]
MKKKHLLYLSLLSGFIMCLAWYNTMYLGFLMLAALVPLLKMEDLIAANREKLKLSSCAAFVYSYPAFFLYAFFNTWWISNASFIGYVVPIAEAAFMSVVFQLYSYIKKAASNKTAAYFFLCLYWIAYEYIQYTWDINFPWLNFGNSFAHWPVLIQWYSLTGTEGGSLWMLLSNISIYIMIKHWPLKTHESKRKRIVLYTCLPLVVLLPVVCSLIMWANYEDDSTESINVVCVQPNLDPYNEQYYISSQQLVKRIVNLAEESMDENVSFFVLPESCLQEYAWEDSLEFAYSVRAMKQYVKNYGSCGLIAGMSTRSLLPYGVKTPAARPVMFQTDRYYESYNTALFVPDNEKQNLMQLRHKSVLVVGVEKLPFKKYLPFVEKLALDMGGTVGSLGTDTSAKVFVSHSGKVKVGVPICWESIDGNYSRQFVNNGADFLQIITNVGWWGDTPGYKQYFYISALRALENRRYVSVCANTGFTGLVNARGQIISKSGYWQQDVYKFNVPLLKHKTLFTLKGDMIMKPFAFFSLLLIVYSVIKNKTQKQKK